MQPDSRETSPNFASDELRPSLSIQVGLNLLSDHEELVIAAHTDTIQAMLLVTSRYPELAVMIRGRTGEDEEPRILADPLYQAFTKKRVEREGALQATGLIMTSRPLRLTADQSAEYTSFQCKFFNMNELVQDLLAGRTTANHLMVNFGGITDLEVASDVATIEQLEDYSKSLVWEIHARQLGEVPGSILKDRLIQNLV